MTQTAAVTRFEPDGPTGLETWEQMDYASLIDGEPVQKGHLYHEIEAQGYMVGVWDCTAFTDKMMPYPVDEFMLFLEGSLTMVMPNGTEVQINPGDAFVIPKGLVCQWKQTGYVRKYFMILDGPIPDANNASLNRITVPDLASYGAIPDIATTRKDFVNAANTMTVEVETFGALSRPCVTLQANQLVTVLDGELNLHDGVLEHSFKQGETVYIRQGDTVGWSTIAGTRTLSARYIAPA